jgi:hypothetical protein
MNGKVIGAASNGLNEKGFKIKILYGTVTGKAKVKSPKSTPLLALNR